MDMLAVYRELCRAGLYGTAQSPDWIAAFAAHAARDAILATLSKGGRPLLALALAVTGIGPVRVALFPGGSHANGNFAALAPNGDGRVQPEATKALIAAVAEARPDIDVLLLQRQLPSLHGVDNPLLPWSAVESPDLALAASLEGGFEALLQRVNGKRKRKKHRSQTRKFEAAGGFRRLEAATREDVDRLLDAFFAMRSARFERIGAPDAFADPAIRASFRQLFSDALANPDRPFRLHALEVGGTIRAVTGSSRRGDHIVCEFTAMRDDELAAASPGDFLFFENIREACDEGMRVYDFSVGDETYKRQWCDIETRHFDAILPLTLKGRAFAVAYRSLAAAKRAVKRNPALWALAKRLRRTRGVEANSAAAEED